MCHGADRAGTPAAPSLLGVGGQINGPQFRRIVTYGTSARARLVSIDRSAGGDPRTIEATFRVPAVQAASGWVYQNQPLKAGLPFRFETSSYAIQGQALAVRPLGSGR